MIFLSQIPADLGMQIFADYLFIFDSLRPSAAAEKIECT